jgi:hypothetical protein
MEEVGGPAQMQARLAPRALTSQPLAVEQLGVCLQERREGRLGRERRLELRPRVVGQFESSSAAISRSVQT